MRFVWYPRGLANPQLAATVIAMINGIGLSPRSVAVCHAIGKISTAAALLLIVSVKIIVTK